MEPTTTSALKPRKFKSLRTITALVLREMQTTYGRSPGGYIWAVLEPVAALSLFTLVISVGLKIKNPSLGTNFMLFYATGYLPFMMAIQTAAKVATSLKFSRQLMQYPGVRFSDALIARFLLSILTHLMVFYAVMIGITLVFDTGTIFDFPAIFISLAMAASLGIGIGSINCFMFSMFPVWQQIWAILTRPLLLLSTVLYTFEEVPWQYQDYVWWNPAVHVVGLMRRGFFPIYEATYVSVVYVFFLGLLFFVFGLILLGRYHRVILNR